MSFFIDRFNRRKSPIALAAFGAALLYMVIFGVLYGLLAGPLYRAVSLGTPAATTAVHSLIVAVIGTAVCCLLFLLKEKRVAPYGFSGLLVALCMFYAAALLLDGLARSNMLYLITVYGLAPVLVGNAVTWPIYWRMKRANPALNRRKTISEELREAVEKEAAKHPEKEKEEVEETAAEENFPEISATEAMFGPEDNSHYAAAHTAQEEAMLLYFDEDEEESDD